MIITELMCTREDGTNLYRTYSDCGFDLLQEETGGVYSEAIDIEGVNYTYHEIKHEDEPGGDQEISNEKFIDMLEEVL